MVRIPKKKTHCKENAFCKEWRKCKMHKIDWCKGGMKLVDIATKNVGEHDLTIRM